MTTFFKAFFDSCHFLIAEIKAQHKNAILNAMKILPKISTPSPGFACSMVFVEAEVKLFVSIAVSAAERDILIFKIITQTDR